MEEKQPLRILTADLLIADLTAQKNDKLEEVLDRYGLKKDGKRSANDLARNLMGLSNKDDIPSERRGEFNNHIANIYNDFSNAAAGQIKTSPGGSSFNVLSTLAKTLNEPGKAKQVDVTFFGVTGNDDYAEEIQRALDRAGIDRIPKSLPEEVETAKSFVIKYPAEHPGDVAGRTIITFPGNAADVIKPHLITRDIVDANDVLLVQGSIWQKLQKTTAVDWGHAHESHLGFADRLLRLRWETGKKLWLTLPTTAEFNPQSNSHFQDLIRSANLILSNDEELSRVYTREDEHKRINAIIKERGLQIKRKDEHDKEPTEAEKIEAGREVMRDHHIDFKEVFNFYTAATPGYEEQERKAIKDMLIVLKGRNITYTEFAHFDFEHKSITPEKGFERLEHVMAHKFLESQEAKNHGWKGDTSQVAFITRGKRGAVVLGKDEMGVITMEDVAPVNPKKIESTLGAGDTSFAGFIAGHIKGLSPVESAKIGMALACKKLEVNEAQLPDPKAALRDAVLDRKLHANIANKVLPAELNGYHALMTRTLSLEQYKHKPDTVGIG